MLAGTGLRDHAGLAHISGQQDLAEYIVDLVGTRVVEILPFQINFCPAQILCHMLRIVEHAGPAGIIVVQIRQLFLKAGVLFIFQVSPFQLAYCVHQRFGNILPAVYAESSL